MNGFTKTVSPRLARNVISKNVSRSLVSISRPRVLKSERRGVAASPLGYQNRQNSTVESSKSSTGSPTTEAASTQTVWVNPTLNSEVASKLFPLTVPGTEQVNFEIQVGQFLPGLLDKEQLLKSLEKALAYFPHASGRIRRKGLDWWIEPSKKGIPVTFETSSEPYNHYLYPHAPQGLIDPVVLDCPKLFDMDSDEPLLKLKVTFSPTSNETYIGISSNHMAGDASFLDYLLSAWSQEYQGLEPITPPPSYDKYSSSPPDEVNDNPSTQAFIAKHLPHLQTLYPIPEWGARIGQAMEGTEPIDLMFSAHQIKQIHAIANTWPGKASVKGHMSRQDALAAYLVTVFNQCLPVPITRVSNIMSYRDVKNPIGLKDTDWKIPTTMSIGNAIFQAFTGQMSTKESTSLGGTAWAIRKSIADTRDYEHLKRIVAVSNPIWAEQTREGTEHQFWQGEGGLVLNGFAKNDMTESHFGFGSERTRNMFYGSFPGYIRFFAGSPVKLAGGEDSWQSNKGAVWMFTRIPKDIKDKFLSIVATELFSPGFPQNLVAREKEVLDGDDVRL